MHLGNEAVIAGYAIAGNHLRFGIEQCGNSCELSGQRADPQVGANRQRYWKKSARISPSITPDVAPKARTGVPIRSNVSV